MNIWIINYYAASPEKVTNPRYLELAHHFMAAGHEVITFNSSIAEGVEEQKDIFVQRAYGEYQFVHVSSPAFIGNGIKRMYSIFKFACNLFKVSISFDKPDVILHNIHPPFDYPIVKLSQKLKCKYIAEAWDLWPADFVTFGLIKESNPALKIAYAIEKQYYYHSDDIIFTFLGGVDYLKNKHLTKETGGKVDLSRVHYINNGINLTQFDSNKNNYPRNDEDLNKNNIYKIIYLGSIRTANNVKTLIDAAVLLRNNPKYHFFIYGDGECRKDLEQYVKENCIDNVTFKEHWINYEECAWVVSQATVNLMNYQKKFGWMGVSSGKMFQYLAAGKPIVCNIDIVYDDVITDNNLGVAKDMETAKDFADAIKKIVELPVEEYNNMCKRVREVAEKFDYEKLAAKELEIIQKCCNN